MRKKLLCFSLVVCLSVALSSPVYAMHIIEGFLSPTMCIAWGAVSLPFVIWGLAKLKKTFDANPKAIVIFALCAAFAFVLSALKIPSVSGSSSHPTGVGLGAILFGPLAMSVVSLIILLFQAILLAHGGLTTLGANLFSMGIAGPVFSFIIYKLFIKLRIRKDISVFTAAFVGCMITYITTSLQLALEYPESGNILVSLYKFLGIFAITQIPLAIVEGIVTVVVFQVVEKYNGTLINGLLNPKRGD